MTDVQNEVEHYLSADDIVRQVEDLGPLVEIEADDVSKSGCLTPALVDGLRKAGAFRMTFPDYLGGPAMRLEQQTRVIETLARHDASVAWNVSILADGGFFAGQVDPDTARSLYPSLDLPTATTSFPPGRAEMLAKGGYLARGAWEFGSGVRNCERIVVGFHRYDRDGEVLRGEDSKPELSWAWVPVASLSVHDTWHSTGLNGTGSASFEMEPTEIPESWFITDDPSQPVSRPPTSHHRNFLPAKGVGVPLGIARRALDEFYEFSQRSRASGGAAVRTEPDTAAAVGEAEAYLAAARGLVYRTFEDVSETVWTGRTLSARQEGMLAAAIAGAGRLCRTALEIVMEEAGSRGVLASLPFDRLYRDMSTVARHLVYRRRFYRVAGERLLNPDTGRASWL
jgi:alkylation response protein AidB-like acyl-CoA dehydrogenase